MSLNVIHGNTQNKIMPYDLRLSVMIQVGDNRQSMSSKFTFIVYEFKFIALCVLEKSSIASIKIIPKEKLLAKGHSEVTLPNKPWGIFTCTLLGGF